MTELGRTGPTINTYWVAHGTTLLRVINEYLRPDLNHHDETEPTQRAKQALDQIRDCSTTLYTDLTKPISASALKWSPKMKMTSWNQWLTPSRTHQHQQNLIIIGTSMKMVLLGHASTFDDGRHFMCPQLINTPHDATSKNQEPPRTGTTTFILRTDRRQPTPTMTTPPIGEATGEQ